MTRTQNIPGGIAEALTMIHRLPTAILRYPSGRFGLVGAIPVELSEPNPQAYTPGQRRSKSWPTEAEAIAALLAIGVTRFQLDDCSWYAPDAR